LRFTPKACGGFNLLRKITFILVVLLAASLLRWGDSSFPIRDKSINTGVINVAPTFRGKSRGLIHQTRINPVPVKTGNGRHKPVPDRLGNVAPTFVEAKEKRKGNLKEKKQQLRGVHSEIKRKRAILHEVKQKEKMVTSELKRTEQELAQAKQELSKVSLKLTQANMQKEVVTSHLKEAENKFSRQQEHLSSRLRQTYKYGRVGLAEVFLGARDYWDFLNRANLLQRIVKQDARILREVKVSKEKVAQKREELVEKCNQINNLKGEVKKEEGKVARQRQAKAVALEKVKQERAAYEQALAELERSSRQIEGMIRRLEAAARTRYGHWSGRFIKPVEGRITSGFGWRIHPIYKIRMFHEGIDIGAGQGTPIVAAGRGVVISSGWYSGYGNTVIIAHGSGISTLYGHCSSLKVAQGEKVAAGQVIAYVGSTGLSTGPHLHFEVRKNGKPVNPLGY